MEDLYRRLDEDPRFHALARQRSRLSWGLSAVVLLSYYGFILTLAFHPSVLAAPLPGETVVTVGVVVGLGVIALCVTLTGLYIWQANRKFDGQNELIVRDDQGPD